MKCAYCLEEIAEGASVCSHCTREQPWATSARHWKTAGCIATIIAVPCIGFILLAVIGSTMHQADEQRRANQAYADSFTSACSTFVKAGDFTSMEDCQAKADLTQLDTVTGKLEAACNKTKADADQAVLRCERRAVSTKPCARLQRKADAVADIDHCKIELRRAERAAGIAINQVATTTPPH